MYARTNSILLSGNFATTLSLTTQLRVHSIEESCGLSPPNFKNIFWYIGLYYKTALGEIAVRKRQYRRRRGQIEREGTKLSKIKELRAKLRVDHAGKLKKARVVAEQKIKRLAELGGKPSEPKPLPPTKGKGKGRGSKSKGKGAKANKKGNGKGGKETVEAEPPKPVLPPKPMTELEKALKEADDAIAYRDSLERDIIDAEEQHRVATERESDLRSKQEIEMHEMQRGQLSIRELRELMKMQQYLRDTMGPEHAWRVIHPPPEGLSVEADQLSAANASKLKSDIRRANEARAAGIAKGTDGMEGVNAGENDTTFIKYHHRPLPTVVRCDKYSDEIPSVIKNPLQLLDELDRLFWFQRAHACARKGVPCYAEDFAELDEDDAIAKIYDPKNPKYSFLWDKLGRPPGIGKRGVDMKGLCKCHLKKCLVCRNCEKRHCWCPGGPLDPHAPPIPKKKPKPKKKPPPVVKPPPAPKPPRKGPIVQKAPKPKLTAEQEQALVRMKWRRRLALDTVQGTAAQKEAQNLATTEQVDPLTEALKAGNRVPPKIEDKSTLKGTKLNQAGSSDTRKIAHRASCHRCGNLRKKTMKCDRCPHVFCQKCGEKMIEEHGEKTFKDGCPVCNELCCCGVNRSVNCVRKFHCYKKCPAMKKLGRRAAKSGGGSPSTSKDQSKVDSIKKDKIKVTSDVKKSSRWI